MSFKEIPLKISYDSDEDENLILDFYVPVLEKSIEYLRITGSFSSSSLVVAARGIIGLIRNKGSMKIIADANIRSCDLEAIIAGKNLENIISNNIINDFNSIESEIVKDHVAALGWLISTKKLEIKIILLYDDKGNLIPIEKSKKMFHPKIGIFRDSGNNSISFSGSVNESLTGWTGNIEEFKVYRSWKNVENDYLSEDLKKFEKFWTGNIKKGITMNIPDAVKSHLISLAPSSSAEMEKRLLKWYKLYKDKHSNFELQLWNHQIEAIDSWVNSKFKGIWEMATGSGKTLAAIKAAQKLHDNINKSLLVLIICPYKVLVDQWSKILIGLSLNAWKLDKSWQDKLNQLINFNKWGQNNISFLIMTYDKLTNEYIRERLKGISELMIIADEVHNFGANNRKIGMLEEFKYRLGLSATPDRWFDEPGSELIDNYFNGVIYKYSLAQAISDGKLTHYFYYPYLVELTEHETLRYVEISKQINQKMAINKNLNVTNEGYSNYSSLLFERSNILKKASKKISIFADLIKNNIIPLESTLIYCNDQKQIAEVQKILNDFNIYSHQKFTSEESDFVRNQLLTDFENGKIKILVAIRCLDEGIDIPKIKNAVILSSTTNPREFIQRRGRILRCTTNKTEAKIYDFIITPNFNFNFNTEINSILNKELSRYSEFIKLSKNPEFSSTLLLNIAKKVI